MNLNNNKLSKLMLTANLISTLFYSTSYPYIYAETIKVVPHMYIGIEQIVSCLGTIVFCKIWNAYSDKLFRYYDVFLWLEIVADIVLFADVLIRQNLSFYFLLNVISGGDVLRICQLEEQLDKAKELLRLAVSDINYTLTNVDECAKCLYCDAETGDCSSTERCYDVCKWKYADEVMKLMGE